MKIFFDTTALDSSEILSVLGFTDSDIRMARLVPYLRAASREMREVIGAENYGILEAAYDGGNIDDELLTLVRYAVALDAFRNFAPLNDLSYTNDGRLFRRDDHQVGAFEWQIERSNAAMERSYYRAVDEVISYIIQVPGYALSDFISQFSGLYVPDLRNFQKFVDLGGSHLLYLKLAPSLRICEQREIINRVGDHFEEFKKAKDGMIYNLIQQCCVYFAMADGIQKLSVQLFPEGLMKTESFGKKAASGYDREAVTLFYRRELQGLLKTLEFEIKRLNPLAPRRTIINFGTDDGFVTVS